MDLRPRCYSRILELIRKGVDIPNPLSLDIGEEVDLNLISGRDVKIYPGCRIYGADTVISRGSRIGYEGPVTIDGCQLGPEVELKGGFFKRSVFLNKANMGLGAHVREGCILEEEANGAHCVGLKQTILFPFVTLGSLINFCDCLMAGGISRKNHSEVGSSFIHFNFTPDGDKATPSLIGDVPRGVMLNRRAIFLGGQGGIVGPVRIGYGNVVVAGSILRNNVLEEDRLVVGKTHAGKIVDFVPRTYRDLKRVVENNIVYLANLRALEEWYVHVRRPFFDVEELGPWVYRGALEKLDMAVKERVKRLEVLAEKSKTRPGKGGLGAAGLAESGEFHEKFAAIKALFTGGLQDDGAERYRDSFLDSVQKAGSFHSSDYLSAVKAFPEDVAARGTLWLQSLVDAYCARAQGLLTFLFVQDGGAGH